MKSCFENQPPFWSKTSNFFQLTRFFKAHWNHILRHNLKNSGFQVQTNIAQRAFF